jgi:hypothetical protein
MFTPDIITDAPEPFKFILKGKQRKGLFFWKKQPFSMELTMFPMTLSTIRKVSRIMVTISKDVRISEEDSIILHTNKLTAKHLSSIAKVLAITIEPRHWFRRKRLQYLILRNTSPLELINLLKKAIEMMDMNNFIKSVVYVMGLNIMAPGGRMATAEEAAELIKSQTTN